MAAKPLHYADCRKPTQSSCEPQTQFSRRSRACTAISPKTVYPNNSVASANETIPHGSSVSRPPAVDVQLLMNNVNSSGLVKPCLLTKSRNLSPSKTISSPNAKPVRPEMWQTKGNAGRDYPSEADFDSPGLSTSEDLSKVLQCLTLCNEIKGHILQFGARNQLHRTDNFKSQNEGNLRYVNRRLMLSTLATCITSAGIENFFGRTDLFKIIKERSAVSGDKLLNLTAEKILILWSHISAHEWQAMSGDASALHEECSSKLDTIMEVLQAMLHQMKNRSHICSSSLQRSLFSYRPRILKGGTGIIFQMCYGVDGNAECRVDNVLEGSPADICGLVKAGHILLSIDDQTIDTTNIDDVVQKAIGPFGSSVCLRFRSPENKEDYCVNLVRNTDASAQSDDSEEETDESLWSSYTDAIQLSVSPYDLSLACLPKSALKWEKGPTEADVTQGGNAATLDSPRTFAGTSCGREVHREFQVHNFRAQDIQDLITSIEEVKIYLQEEILQVDKKATTVEETFLQSSEHNIMSMHIHRCDIDNVEKMIDLMEDALSQLQNLSSFQSKSKEIWSTARQENFASSVILIEEHLQFRVEKNSDVKINNTVCLEQCASPGEGILGLAALVREIEAVRHDCTNLAVRTMAKQQEQDTQLNALKIGLWSSNRGKDALIQDLKDAKLHFPESTKLISLDHQALIDKQCKAMSDKFIVENRKILQSIDDMLQYSRAMTLELESIKENLINRLQDIAADHANLHNWCEETYLQAEHHWMRDSTIFLERESTKLETEHGRYVCGDATNRHQAGEPVREVKQTVFSNNPDEPEYLRILWSKSEPKEWEQTDILQKHLTLKKDLNQGKALAYQELQETERKSCLERLRPLVFDNNEYPVGLYIAKQHLQVLILDVVFIRQDYDKFLRHLEEERKVICMTLEAMAREVIIITNELFSMKTQADMREKEYEILLDRLLSMQAEVVQQRFLVEKASRSEQEGLQILNQLKQMQASSEERIQELLLSQLDSEREQAQLITDLETAKRKTDFLQQQLENSCSYGEGQIMHFQAMLESSACENERLSKEIESKQNELRNLRLEMGKCQQELQSSLKLLSCMEEEFVGHRTKFNNELDSARWESSTIAEKLLNTERQRRHLVELLSVERAEWFQRQEMLHKELYLAKQESSILWEKLEKANEECSKIFQHCLILPADFEKEKDTDIFDLRKQLEVYKRECTSILKDLLADYSAACEELQIIQRDMYITLQDLETRHGEEVTNLLKVQGELIQTIEAITMELEALKSCSHPVEESSKEMNRSKTQGTAEQDDPERAQSSQPVQQSAKKIISSKGSDKMEPEESALSGNESRTSLPFGPDEIKQWERKFSDLELGLQMEKACHAKNVQELQSARVDLVYERVVLLKEVEEMRTLVGQIEVLKNQNNVLNDRHESLFREKIALEYKLAAFSEKQVSDADSANMEIHLSSLLAQSIHIQFILSELATDILRCPSAVCAGLDQSATTSRCSQLASQWKAGDEEASDSPLSVVSAIEWPSSPDDERCLKGDLSSDVISLVFLLAQKAKKAVAIHPR